MRIKTKHAGFRHDKHYEEFRNSAECYVLQQKILERYLESVTAQGQWNPAGSMETLQQDQQQTKQRNGSNTFQGF